MKGSFNTFVIADPNKCIGCKACELACSSVHNEENNIGYTVGTMTTPVIPRLYLVKNEKFCAPIQCRHCEDAPCANACPNKAIKKEDDSIYIDENCIGCKTCLMACPIGAIELLPHYKNEEKVIQLGLEEEKMIAYKCDLCKGKEKKACIEACPENALKLVNIKEDKKNKNIKAALGLMNL